MVFHKSPWVRVRVRNLGVIFDADLYFENKLRVLSSHVIYNSQTRSFLSPVDLYKALLFFSCLDYYSAFSNYYYFLHFYAYK